MSETGDCALVEVRLGGRKSETSDSRTELDHPCTSHDPHIGVDEVCLPRLPKSPAKQMVSQKKFPYNTQEPIIRT
jgi:hypothetical protein